MGVLDESQRRGPVCEVSGRGRGVVYSFRQSSMLSRFTASPDGAVPQYGGMKYACFDCTEYPRSSSYYRLLYPISPPLLIKIPQLSSIRRRDRPVSDQNHGAHPKSPVTRHACRPDGVLFIRCDSAVAEGALF